MTLKPQAMQRDGLDGWCLANDVAEAFLLASPYPRVASFQLRNGTSPLKTSTTTPFFGIRTWFLEPIQLPTAPLPALQPAKAAMLPDGTLSLVADPEPQTGLQVILEISLDASGPRLRILHRLVNHAPQSRNLAAWSILVFPHEGVGVTPWARGERSVRSCLFWPGVHPGEPAIRVGASGVGVDFRQPPVHGWIKIGTNTDAGWTGYLWPGGTLLSTVRHVPDGMYPEGGGTVTMYSSGRTREQGFCELEHVGPMTDVAPGGTVELEQTLDLFPSTGEIPEEDAPDSWIAAVEALRKGEPCP